jgi:prophage regulatory protein
MTDQAAGQGATDRRQDRLLRFPEVFIRTGLSDSTMRRREAKGTFPARVPMGPKMVGWYESDVGRWVADPIGYRA